MTKNNKKWYAYERQSHYSLDKPSITIAANCIFFNSALVKKMGLKNFKSIRIEFDDQDPSKATAIRLVGNNDGSDMFNFTIRHPKSERSLRANIACMTVIRECPRLSKLQDNKKKSERRVFVDVDEKNHLFSFSLIPNFEYKTKNLVKLDTVPAIYKIFNNGELIYIGETKNLKARTAHHRLVDKWTFDEIGYSILESNKDRLYWENDYLEKFEKENGNLPIHNNNRGHRNVVPINY
tara:strand:- start:156 stop:866 length:711 start_codon:yes stop_codon:yes gene_type:complete